MIDKSSTCFLCKRLVFVGDKYVFVRARRTKHPKTLWHIKCWEDTLDDLLG